MPAFKESGAASTRLGLALPLRTVVDLIILQISLAVSTFLHLSLSLIMLAIFAQMIWLNLTLAAEVVTALITPYPKLTHVLGRCLSHGLAILLLDIVVDIACDYFYRVSALTPY
jgi:hypothetical protein